MAATVELGGLSLSHPRAGLQLEAAVALTAPPPSTINLSAALTAPSAWLCRGPGFHLALHLSLDGCPLPNQLQPYLAHSICNADFWKQLNLQATTAQEPSLDGNLSSVATDISVHLTYLNRDIVPNSRHRLPAARSVHDIQPPLGVEVVRLTSAVLKLDFSSSSRTRNSTAASETKGADLWSSPLMPAQTEEMVCLVTDDVPSRTGHQDAMLLDDIAGMMAYASSPTGDHLPHLNPSTAIPQHSDSGTAFADDQPSKGEAKQHELGQHILELTDSALRLAICEKPPKLPSGVKLTRNDVTRLATVVPALWRPNHIKPISERAPFLPTIAHALSRSLVSNARSASLKRKATELLGRYSPAVSRAGPSSPAGVQQRKGPNSVYEAASIGLWNLLQRSHFDSGTGGRLKPLIVHTGDVSAKGLAEPDDMLFEISDTWQGDSNPFAGLSDAEKFGDSSVENGLIWECDDEYVGKDESTLSEAVDMPPATDSEQPALFDDSHADEQMLLDAGDAVEYVRGAAPAAVPARPRHQVSTACEGDTTGENSLFETAERTETCIPAFAYDCLLAEPEMLFDADV